MKFSILHSDPSTVPLKNNTNLTPLKQTKKKSKNYQNARELEGKRKKKLTEKYIPDVPMQISQSANEDSMSVSNKK